MKTFTSCLFAACVVTGLNSLAGQAQAAVPWQLQANEAHGFPELSAGGQAAVATSLAFWGSQWKWADASTQQTPLGDSRRRLQGQVPDLGVGWTAVVAPAGTQAMQYELRTQAKSDLANVVGGGLVFKFDLATFGQHMGQPVLLPGNTGWQWGREGGAQFTMRFSPALPKVYFERNNPAEVRALWYDGQIRAGDQAHTITLSWTGNTPWLPTRTERLGGPAPATWPQDTLDSRTAPLDLGALLARASASHPNGSALVGAAGGGPRWWGTNVTAYALFRAPREVVAQQARRLAALGYNLVRLHHHDSPWVSPNVFGDPSHYRDTGTLDADAMAKLDWWIKCLKDEGVSVWLDLHVMRAIKAGDGIDGFAEAAKGKDSADLKGYNYVNPSMQRAMQRFNDAYLNHHNPHTGLAYKDDPAVLAIQITNENDVTHHFGNKLLPDKQVPQHHKLYRQAADAFARQHGLPRDKVWRSWEAGPSKLFLNDLEQRFNVDMVDHLRRLGVKAPLSTTSSWGHNPIASLPALTVGDVVDVHSYGGPGQLEKDPAYAAHLGHWAAAAQVLGKPLTVSEWNAEPFPLADRHTLPLLMAAMGSHQGWRAVLHYAYSQETPRGNGSASNWHAYNDPSLLPMLSAAALMYRRGDVREASTTYVFDPGAEVFFGQAISAGNSPALRSAADKGKLLIAMPATSALPWLKRTEPPAGAVVLTDPQRSVLPEGAQEAVSDTGELTRHWGKGSYLINTPRTQAAMGWIGGETIRLPAAQLDLRTRHASVAVQSLDHAPLGETRQVLVSIGTRSEPQPGNKTPYRVEPLAGELRLKAPRGLTLYRNGPFNQWTEHPARYVDGHYHIALEGRLPVQWLLLRAAAVP